MPTKSVCAICGFAIASLYSGEPTPKTRVMSPVGAVELFSSSMFAVPTPPKSQPARERHPRSRRRLAGVGDHVRQRVSDRVDGARPVLERAGEVRDLARRVVVVAVRHRLALPVRIEAGERRQDPARGVRDQNRVVVGEERPIALQEVEQVRHLLEVRGDVRVVAVVVRVVELDLDHVLDAVAVGAELAALGVVLLAVAVVPDRGGDAYGRGGCECRSDTHCERSSSSHHDSPLSNAVTRMPQRSLVAAAATVGGEAVSLRLRNGALRR
jgi:hypothetical protein